jgi:hypothetical protein
MITGSEKQHHKKTPKQPKKIGCLAATKTLQRPYGTNRDQQSSLRFCLGSETEEVNAYLEVEETEV